MHEALVLQVGSNLLLEWSQVRQHIAMRNHNTLGVRCGAGGKDNFERVVVSGKITGPCALLRPTRFPQLLHDNEGGAQIAEERLISTRRDDQFCADLL